MGKNPFIRHIDNILVAYFIKAAHCYFIVVAIVGLLVLNTRNIFRIEALQAM